MSRAPRSDPAPFVRLLGLENVKVLGSGLAFTVYQADSPSHGPVALRVPSLDSDIISNINDGYIPVLALLSQDLTIFKFLADTAVPVPTSYGLFEADGKRASLASFIPSDDSEPDARDAGKHLAQLHRLQPPEGMNPVVQHGQPIWELIPARLKDRWASLLSFVPDLPPIPSQEAIAACLARLDRFPNSLLHLDFRAANLRTRQGKIIGILDWENALVGPAAMDLMRVLEIGGFEEREFSLGYAEVAGKLPELTTQEELILRLDAALMLNLVFFSEAPDPEQAKRCTARVRDIVSQLAT